jgi:triosephosphate isomerase
MGRKLVVGNWKMHGSHVANAELLAGILEASPYLADVAVCAPYPYLAEVAVALTGSRLYWGAQDCSSHEQGAYTGEVSAAMLHEFGCRYVIVGHSERRAYHAENDQLVADKAKAALARGVTPIVCVGETLAQREAGETETVVKRQLSAVVHTLAHCIGEIVVAYEPVWAIGTGKTATPAGEMRLLYGGSVKTDNARTLFAQPDIDGGLIGGASLKAADFTAICRAAE